MVGIIQSIEEVRDVCHYDDDRDIDINMDGYRVATDEHTVSVLINNRQACCEKWGYFASEDDLPAFVGAELREIQLTDTALHREKVEASGYYGNNANVSGIQFVDFVTSLGTFQLAVYNAHNGYYGHGILVVQDDTILLNKTL